MKRIPDRSAFVTALRLLGSLIPGDYLKTVIYLNVIAKPRTWARKWMSSFYRTEMVYGILGEFRSKYKGPFSILELGTANGYSFNKMLYATRFMKMDDQVTCHAFDSFEGLRPPTDKEDSGLMSNDWKEGQYKGNYETLKEHCEKKGYTNFCIHKGYFEDTIDQELVKSLDPPMLVWVDCDYFKPALHAFKELLPILPSGCVFYFDDFEFNYGSRFTGEARLVDEVNRGIHGPHLEFIKDLSLGLDSRSVYRFINYADNSPQFERKAVPEWEGSPRPIGNGSPFP
jgi:hypothetical protein